MEPGGPGFIGYVTAVGFIANLFAGVVGVGAVLLIAPLLYFFPPLLFGVTLDFKAISNLTTFAVVIAAVRSLLLYKDFGLLRREIITPMAVPSFVFAVVGVVGAHFASPRALQVVFAVASLVGAACFLLPYQRALDTVDRTFERRPLGYAAVASVVGFVGGFAGAGGGFLLIPALMGVFRLPTRIALGTAAVTGLINALVAFVGRVALLHVDWVLVAALGVGSVIGTDLGTRFQQRVPTLILRRAIIAVVIVSGFRLLVR
jgi:uncharacterized membrane protein YfcA